MIEPWVPRVTRPAAAIGEAARLVAAFDALLVRIVTLLA
jgi:hypothetical protein